MMPQHLAGAKRLIEAGRGLRSAFRIDHGDSEAVWVSPCRVLIADDTPDIRMMLRWSLEPDERFEVIGEAENGAVAVMLATAEKPDVVILDLAMPVMDGLQAIPEIRKGSPHTKIIILSAFEAGSMSEEAIARGADAYVEKGRPFDEIAELLVELCAAA